MDTNCPHCGTEYEIDKSEYGRYVKCEICGKGFVAGTFVAKKLGKVANAVNDGVKITVTTAYKRAKDIDRKAQHLRAKAVSDSVYRMGRSGMQGDNGSSYKKVSVMVAAFGIVAGAILYLGFNSGQKGLSEEDYSCGSYPLSSYSSASTSSYSASDSDAIGGALANVKSRYRGKLLRYGLTESYFDETSEICDLMLLDVNSWTKFQIVYYRATGQIEWPRTMPKSVAEDLMQDRLIIHAYESSLGEGESNANLAK